MLSSSPLRFHANSSMIVIASVLCVLLCTPWTSFLFVIFFSDNKADTTMTSICHCFYESDCDYGYCSRCLSGWAGIRCGKTMYNVLNYEILIILEFKFGI